MTAPGALFVVVSRDAIDKIKSAEANSGRLGLKHLPSEDMYVVSTVDKDNGVTLPVDIPSEYKILCWSGPKFIGQWIRRPLPNLHLMHLYLLRRPGTFTPFELFEELVPAVKHPGKKAGFVITYDPDLSALARENGASEYAGWLITENEVSPVNVAIEPETIGIEQLRGHWPVEELAALRILVVGLGSIGGAAAQALAAYGVGHLDLIDPDRLLWHNTVRHILGPESVGRHKVHAVRTVVGERWPRTVVQAHPINVVTDAHLVRAQLPSIDLVLCAADGIAPRRVVSHLARRNGIPAILACVLDDGAYGEVLRLRTGPRFGCLLCHRAHLVKEGGIDAEANQELDYGTGHTHRSMTAVGPDLHLIGQLAAKAAVATLLHARGHDSQRLPGEHAVIGLRPTPGLNPPFDLSNVERVEWHPGVPPRANCPTCSTT